MTDTKTLKIGLCDDEKAIHALVAEILGKDYVLLHFDSAEQLLASKEPMDCLLLDIDMPEMDGIEAARKLQRRGISYKIIMLTSKRERFKEAFEINAFRFVTKPIDSNELLRALEDVYRRLLGVTKVTVYREGVSYELTQNRIVYIAANRSETIVYTREEQFRSEGSLAQWQEILEKKLFFQCHKSYIVNLAEIESIGDAALQMKTGDKVEVSRRKRRELQSRYMKFLFVM
ncbi:MAG: LytTR family DNA-binding domain-containing protein [Blautia sp.]|nr:LytTR family DNA-binding domain-containing protein [Blautia sp.]